MACGCSERLTVLNIDVETLCEGCDLLVIGPATEHCPDGSFACSLPENLHPIRKRPCARQLAYRIEYEGFRCPRWPTKQGGN